MEKEDLIKNWEKDKREVIEMINSEFKALIRQVLDYCEIAIPSRNKDDENFLRYQTLRSKLLGCINHSRRNILEYLRDFIIGRISHKESYKFNFNIRREENGEGRKTKESIST